MNSEDPGHPQLLATLLELSQALNSENDLSVILRQVVFAVRDLISCRDASLVLWNGDRGRFESGASTNMHDVAMRVRQRGGATRWIMDQGEPLVVHDRSRDPLSSNPMIGESGIRSYAGVPILHGPQRLGVLYALSDAPHQFGPTEVSIMESLASVAATAIHNALLVNRLEQLSQFKDALIRLAAHDLRNPVSLATGYLDILIQELHSNGEAYEQFTEPMMAAMKQMLEIIDDVLDFTRWAPGAQLARKRFEINNLAASTVDQHRFLAERKEQELELRRSEESLHYAGDAVLLGRALGNLIANAIKYTPEGGDIVVSVENHPGEVVLVVQDSGPGIPQDEMSELFRPFTRLSSAGQEPGSGLGLSLVRLIVERHGGRVDVASKLGEGSEFSMRLPVN